jgi:hypothetical protein
MSLDELPGGGVCSGRGADTRLYGGMGSSQFMSFDQHVNAVIGLSDAEARAFK